MQDSELTGPGTSVYWDLVCGEGRAWRPSGGCPRCACEHPVGSPHPRGHTHLLVSSLPAAGRGQRSSRRGNGGRGWGLGARLRRAGAHSGLRDSLLCLTRDGPGQWEFRPRWRLHLGARAQGASPSPGRVDGVMSSHEACAGCVSGTVLAPGSATCVDRFPGSPEATGPWLWGGAGGAEAQPCPATASPLVSLVAAVSLLPGPADPAPQHPSLVLPPRGLGRSASWEECAP